MAIIIRSMLEQDLYKLNMCCNVLRHNPGIPVEYRFINRRPEKKFERIFLEKFEREIDAMSRLRLTKDEADFLQEACPYLPPHFLAYLREYQYDTSQLQYSIQDDELVLSIKGAWESAMMWEVPLMAIISELFFRYCEPADASRNLIQEVAATTQRKAMKLGQLKVAEFGLRRRYSYEVQDKVVQTLSQSLPQFVGTSNVHLAHKYGLRPVGTMAHEKFMAYSVLSGMRHANRHVLQDWSQTFKGNVGIALTDTFGTDAFLRDFDGILARLYDGVRHDSGDPCVFGDKIIQHYKSLNINPQHKTLVFTNGLTPDEALHIERYFHNRIQVSFGIGTNLSNDIKGQNPLNIVIKLWKCDNVPVVKLSDETNKASGEPDAVAVARWVFEQKSL